MDKPLEEILKQKEYDSIREQYLHWSSFMEQEVEFQLKTSDLQTKEHCKRVLFFALLIGDIKHMSPDDLDALCMAACFHDSRRYDDGYDVGHGQRAALYYKEYCNHHPLLFDKRAYYAMYYHDLDDKVGIDRISSEGLFMDNGILIYQIFKDADALDRYRLGTDALDVKFLRNEEARNLIDLAKKLNGIHEELPNHIERGRFL